MYLNVSIYKPIQLNVVVVLAEGIDQHLGDFQPSHVEAELKGTHRVDWLAITGYSFTAVCASHLQRREKWEIHVGFLVFPASDVGAFDKLSAEQGGKEVRVQW